MKLKERAQYILGQLVIQHGRPIPQRRVHQFTQAAWSSLERQGFVVRARYTTTATTRSKYDQQILMCWVTRKGDKAYWKEAHASK